MGTTDIKNNEPHIVIDENRVITVPDSLKRLAVQFDHNIETVTFDCPRYWDGQDLSQMVLYINYISKKTKAKGCCLATNIIVDSEDENLIHFDWTISNNASKTKGALYFLVCAKTVDEEGNEDLHWNSELCEDTYISEGLECDEQIVEKYPDVLTQLTEMILNGSGGSDVGQTTEHGGEVFNDYETNKAGSMAFTVKALDANAKTYTLDSTEGLEVGDVYSIYLIGTEWAEQKENYGKITAINDNVVTVDKIFTVPDFITKETYITDGLDSEENAFRIIAKPNIGTRSIGFCTHAEGRRTQALSKGSHSEGCGNVSYGSWSHTEGKDNGAAYAAHSEGMNNDSSGICSHTEGSNNIATRGNTHAEGHYTKALFDNAHAEGSSTQAGNEEGTSGHAAHAEGRLSKAIGNVSHAEGNETQATADYAHSEGDKSIASGVGAHAEGSSKATGLLAHSEGSSTASNEKAHAEGGACKAEGKVSHAEGDSTTAKGTAAHAEGSWTAATADAAHAEGASTSATAKGAHAEGVGTRAQKEAAHAEGKNTIAHGEASHAGGIGTAAVGTAQTAIGKYNAEEWDGSLFVVGIGNETARKTGFKILGNGAPAMMGTAGLKAFSPAMIDNLADVGNGNIPKGDKGDTGPQGPQGEQGPKGADGYTPVRGTDYWTSADIAEIQSYINSAVSASIGEISATMKTQLAEEGAW